MQHSKKTLITLLQTIRKMTVYVNTQCIILHLEFLHLFYTFFCMSTSNLRKKQLYFLKIYCRKELLRKDYKVLVVLENFFWILI